MKKSRLLSLGACFYLCVFLAGCYGSSGKDEENGTDECGDIKAAILPVINGVEYPNPDVVTLSASQQLAVGAIITNYGGSLCTATLIAPNIVLTAAHCIAYSGIFTISFQGGRDIRGEDYSFAATDWHVHPQYTGNAPEYDFGIIEISGDTAAAGITPLPVNYETTRILGEDVQVVGYGDTGGGMNTRQWWTTMFVNREATNYYSVFGNGMTGVCHGDSGGPLLYTKDDGKATIMGVASVIDSEDCLGHAFYPRTDYHRDFIETFVPSDPCEGETLEGRCDENVAVWCEDEAIMTDDCGGRDTICGRDGEGNSRCQPPPDPCEGETYEGRCDGNTAIWCEAETVFRRPCGEGELCGDAGDGLRRCADECGLIGREGRCDENNVARWCEDGVIRIRDCTACGQECGWADETMGYYCL
ncbi:MAG: trypsin-like serine protease [Pseudomonadota bacterium]